MAELESDPHPLLARLREREPVSWLPVLDGWLVTRRELGLAVMRDPKRFTVDDPRFTTGRVVGPSMLTLDGVEHAAHRAPFAGPFRLAAVRSDFTALVERECGRLLDAMQQGTESELGTALAGPLAARVVCESLGLGALPVGRVLGWYRSIVSAVTDLTAGGDLPAGGRNGFAALRAAILPVLGQPYGSSLLASAAQRSGALPAEALISNAAVMLFGGIETTEGMILNAAAHLLEHPGALARVRAERTLLANAIEESLRLEPAAAVIDRYATCDVELGGAQIRSGELVRVSIAAANRDPRTFPAPDQFEPARPNARLHLAFAQGPHVCIGMHLARLEARTAIGGLLDRFPALRLAGGARPTGLVFRKPPALRVRWDSAEPYGKLGQ
ncbi:MAG: cytochrome P450 [Solirubrobacteraceae bacterium]